MEGVIAIYNISGKSSQDPTPHIYSLRINREEICQFTHERHLGLGACLMAAADAADKARDARHAEQVYNFLRENVASTQGGHG